MNDQATKKSLGADNTFRELPPGVKLLRTLEGHQDAVKSVAFDPQGGTLASGSEDNTVKLWEARSGKLLRTLEGHQNTVWSVAFDPQGGTLASGSEDNTVKLWEARSGKLLRTLEGHQDAVFSVAFDPQGGTLASGSGDNTVKLWEARSGKLLRTLEGHQDSVWSVAFDPQGGTLASGSGDNTVKLWEARSGKLLRTLEGHQDWVWSVAFDPQGGTLASGSGDNTVKLWEARSGKLLRTLEGHTARVDIVAFSPDGRLLASKSGDHTIRLWSCETWETVAVIPEPTHAELVDSRARLSSHAAAAGHRRLGARHAGRRAMPADPPLGTGLRRAAGQARRGGGGRAAVHHTTGKIVLVGDHSVGKSALGYRLIHGAFKEQASTHGQQFWVFPALGQRRADGTDCEAILWDFAGQPDYRLVHALFVDDADLALVLFDASDLRDPLHGVGFWAQGNSGNAEQRRRLPHHPRGRSDGSRELYADAGGAERVLPQARHRGSDRDERLDGPGHRGTGRADEVPDPLGGQGRDGHDHDLQADQGLRPRPQGSGSGRPDHRHARGTPRPFGGHRCRLAFHRRRDADRRGPPGKLRLRETPADLSGRSSASCSNRNGSTTWRRRSCWRRGGIRRGWGRWRRNGCWPATTAFRS